MSSASGAVSPADLSPVTDSRPVVWTIAGSDSGGGAGIQADLHTLHDLGVHGCSVISAITAQNSVAVKMVDPVLMQSFTAQIDALGVDLPPAAIKIGLLPTRLHVEVLARRLAAIEAPFVVYDPVAIASTGTPMAEPNMLEAVREQLLPRLSLITPNGPELEALTGLPVSSPELVRLAARRLRELGARAVLVKGGHLGWSGDLCLDYYQDETREFWLAASRLDTRHGHGTGCCYASAIAAVVAQDYPVEDAITLARAYLQQGLAAAQGVGQARAPSPISAGPPILPTSLALCWRVQHSIAASGFMRQAVPACRRAPSRRPNTTSVSIRWWIRSSGCAACWVRGSRPSSYGSRICPPLR